MLKIIKGNLLDATEKYIGHQCNCYSTTASGIARSIFDKFPYANTYVKRTDPDRPGTIQILGDGEKERRIINMFAQVYPGQPKYHNWDDAIEREKYFTKCLSAISDIPNLESIAFPYKIGCGLGGGDWDHYLAMLERFSDYVEKNQNAKTAIYQL